MNKDTETSGRTKKRAVQLKKKALRAVTAVTAAASLAAGTLFARPEELIRPDEVRPETQIVCVMEENEIPASKEEVASEEEKRSFFVRLRQSVKNAILKLPVWARAVFVMPFCAAGWGLMTVGNILWSTVLSPVVSFLGKWIVAALMLFGIAVIALKVLFPDLKAKELFNKRNLIALIAACLLMAAADPVAELIWPDKHWAGSLITAGIGLIFVLFVVLPVVARRIGQTVSGRKIAT